MYLNLFVKIFELKKKKKRMNKSNILARKKMGEQIGQPTLLRWFTAESFNISIHVSDWCNDCSTRCLSDCTGQWIIDTGLLAAFSSKRECSINSRNCEAKQWLRRRRWIWSKGLVQCSRFNWSAPSTTSTCTTTIPPPTTTIQRKHRKHLNVFVLTF